MGSLLVLGGTGLRVTRNQKGKGYPEPKRKGLPGTTHGHGGASWNRTSDLSIISAAL